MSSSVTEHESMNLLEILRTPHLMGTVPAYQLPWLLISVHTYLISSFSLSAEMATASGTVVPYVFSDYSQWERKHPSCQNNKSSNKSGLSFVGKKKRQKSSQEGTTNEAEIRPRLLQVI